MTRRLFSLVLALGCGIVTLSAQGSQGTTGSGPLRPYPGIVLPTELKFVDPEYTPAAAAPATPTAPTPTKPKPAPVK